MSTADAYFDRHGYDIDLGDDAHDAAELRHDADALYALGELRTAYRAAVAEQIKKLTHTGQADVRMYLNHEDDSWAGSGLQSRVKAAEDMASCA